MRAAKLKVKPKKAPLSRSIVDEKHIGAEIKDWTNIVDVEKAVRQCLNHYNYYYDLPEIVKWTYPWVKENFTQAEYDKFIKLPDWTISATVGALCKMISHGAKLKTARIEWMKEKIEESLQRTVADRPVVVERSFEKSIERYNAFIDRIEQHLDQYSETKNKQEWAQKSFFDELKADGSSHLIQRVKKYYTPLLDEYKELVEKKTPELVEAYSHLKLSDKRNYITFLQKLVSDTELLSESKKATRKPRVKKKPAADNQIKAINYQKDSAEFKVSSINPINIVGASVVCIFNTKYRQFSYLVAGEGGFTIKGTTINNIDESQSFKKAVRNAEILQALMASSNTKLHCLRALNNLKTTKAAATGRLGEQTIILKAYK